MKPHKLFRFNILYLSLGAAFYAQADTLPSTHGQDGEIISTRLEPIQIHAKKQKTRRSSEVTGLGKLIKSSQTINQEQVLNIRDLTRYDPGIAVVEQGRGASAGYSVRGMDRNRVALSVDGIAQAQSYTAQSPLAGKIYAGSGAINEIEYENVKTVEISKGANSSEYGNGALAGSVAFQTKQAADIIEDGKNWGLQTKNAYSGKNDTFTHSIALAGKSGGWEGLVIYTDRNGHEIKGHKDAGKHAQSYERYIPATGNGGYFIITDECQDGYEACKKYAKPGAKAIAHTETVSAEDYTGANRLLADPLNYRSQSWLLRPGYRFNQRHYVGAVAEYTKQQFDLRDMSFPAYIPTTENGKRKDLAFNSGGPYSGSNIAERLFATGNLGMLKGGYGLNYAGGVFHDEHHTKARYGFEYIYENKEKDHLLDYARIAYDRQKIDLASHMQRVHCSQYPQVDKNCRPDTDKPFSFYESDKHLYREQHNTLQAAFQKSLNTAWSRHRISANLGLDSFRSDLKHSDLYYIYADQASHDSAPDLPPGLTDAERRQWYRTVGNKRNGTRENPYYLAPAQTTVQTVDFCDYTGKAYNYADCTGRLIQGKSRHIALQDNIALGKHIDLGFGARYDYRKTRSDVYAVSTGRHRIFSWNSGIVLKPAAWLDLSYRISTGFRLPSFSEMYGWRAAHDKIYIPELKPEKSRNQEWGIVFKGNFGNLETSYFSNRYQDLIAFGCLKDNRGSCGRYGYQNAQSAKLNGINIIGNIDWNGVWDKLPEGLYSKLAYNRIRVKDAQVNPNVTSATTPFFDALQPSRYIIGLGYDHPNGRWGWNIMHTYSKGKSEDELQGSRKLILADFAQKAAYKRTKSWRITDVSAYYTPKKHLTVRAGIYNIFNYRYTTWEAVRQTSVDAVNRHLDVGSYNRYAAPGRNYALTLEMKF